MVISFKIDEDIKNTLQRYATEENRTLSNYIATLLLEHIKAKEANLLGTHRHVTPPKPR